jgi:hypothetical protein
MTHYQRGESQALALFLLVVVAAIITYLFWTGDIRVNTHLASDVLKVQNKEWC